MAGRGSILFLIGTMAPRRLGLAKGIINLAFGLFLGFPPGAIALAFGLGGREIPAEQEFS